MLGDGDPSDFPDPQPGDPQGPKSPNVTMENQQSATTSREVLVAWVTDPKAMMALLFAISYAIARVIYDSFYGAFGVLPESMGLTQ